MPFVDTNKTVLCAPLAIRTVVALLCQVYIFKGLHATLLATAKILYLFYRGLLSYESLHYIAHCILITLFVLLYIMMLMLAILILGTVHSTFATPFDMQVVLQNAFFESSMVKMIGLGFGSLPSISVPDIPLSTGLWPFLYEIHIKNLRNTSFADVTKD
jgi:hypothetical protein